MGVAAQQIMYNLLLIANLSLEKKECTYFVFLRNTTFGHIYFSI
jgi:hypothetical protein